MLRILTVRQPWASLIVMGHKPVENRPWHSSYRGDVAILAGLALDVGDRAIEAAQRYLGATPSPDGARRVIEALPRGGIIGLTELWGETRLMDSWWFTGPVGLLLRNARLTCQVIPRRGSLALLNLRDEDEREIRCQVRA